MRKKLYLLALIPLFAFTPVDSEDLYSCADPVACWSFADAESQNNLVYGTDESSYSNDFAIWINMFDWCMDENWGPAMIAGCE